MTNSEPTFSVNLSSNGKFKVGEIAQEMVRSLIEKEFTLSKFDADDLVTLTIYLEEAGSVRVIVPGRAMQRVYDD